jgi:hypothetical protein
LNLHLGGILEFQCYIFPLKGELHANHGGLDYLKRSGGYGYSVNRPLKIGAIMMFAHTLSHSFVGETVSITDTYESPNKEWSYEVGYDPNSVILYVPSIKYERLSLIPRFNGKKTHSVVRNYPSLSETEYKMITEGISKTRI